jgi:hypothetical protein
MKIKIITACMIDKKHRKVGEILEVKDSLARELISMEAVVPYRDLPPAPAPVSVQQTKQTKQGK